MRWLILPAVLLALALFASQKFLPDGQILDGIGFGGIILDNRGKPMRLGLSPDSKYRLAIRLDDIAPQAVQALLDYEDSHFYSHPGVNPFSLLRACLSLIGGRRVGGSTITMQVARLRYGLRTSSFTGKLKQIALALALESRHSKEEILEAYFNLAPYGGNIEGIEAASWIYFQKPASQLSASEAAALAIVPQNPNGRHPAHGSRFAAGRSLVTDGPTAPLAISSAAALPFSAPHLALELASNNPGEKVQTSIDAGLQHLTEKSIRNYIGRKRGFGINNAAVLLVRWTDMQVCALAGSADFHSGAIQGQIDGTRARRSPGSTLKPFIYALALDAGLIHPGTILSDTPRSFGGYDPENFDRNFRGPINAAEALRSSRNLPAIQLAGQLSGRGLYGFLKSAGVNFQHEEQHYGLSLVLGGAEVTMRELAALYAMLANNGLYQPLSFRRGQATEPPSPLLSPEAAWLVIDMLRRPEAVVKSGLQSVNLYYKTGTSNGLRDAWTCGILGEYVLIVWVGNFDNRANPNFVGASAALPLFEEIASQLAALNLLHEKLADPLPGLKLTRGQFCANTGDLFSGQCEAVEENWLIAGVSPRRQTPILRKILIDAETGLRSCARAATSSRETWWEFWPSDLEQAFEKAGIHKPHPPQWLPECSDAATAGAPPRIILPKKNVAYQRVASQKNFRLPLRCAADSDAGMISWFADRQFIGSALPGETIFWAAPPGRQKIVAVDSAGRSTSQDCIIEVVP